MAKDMDAIRMLEGARKLIGNGGWTRRYFQRVVDGKHQYCLLGALTKAGERSNEWEYFKAFNTLSRVLRECSGADSIVHYNDALATDARDCQRKIGIAIQRLKKQQK